MKKFLVIFRAFGLRGGSILTNHIGGGERKYKQGIRKRTGACASGYSKPGLPASDAAQPA
jgi:hypothetical protein